MTSVRGTAVGCGRYGTVAQPGERSPHTREVTGSSPVRPILEKPLFQRDAVNEGFFAVQMFVPIRLFGDTYARMKADWHFGRDRRREPHGQRREGPKNIAERENRSRAAAGRNRMKKKIAVIALAMCLGGSLLACGSTEEVVSHGFEEIPDGAHPEDLGQGAVEETEEAPAEEEAAYVLPDDMYYSELTGEPISKEIEDQRPVAIMVDNDARALPHFGISECDVMYELMNSTANDRITRLMCLFKDWGAIEKVGSIRSIRPTNILLGQEWDAVLCHDGGPYYIDDYLSRYPYHFSGTFSRVNNGKATEFTEFCLSGDLSKNFSNTGYSTSYDDRKQSGEHFRFADYGGDEITLEDAGDAVTATNVSLPFGNTKSKLVYNESTGTYDYYEFGEICKDGGNDAVVTFKNVIVQNCSFTQYDEHGYMIYNCIQSGESGYYCTNGKAIPITWSKSSEGGMTKYYNAAGEEITLNTGRTYITLVPSDTWSSLTLS